MEDESWSHSAVTLPIRAARPESGDLPRQQRHAPRTPSRRRIILYAAIALVLVGGLASFFAAQSLLGTSARDYALAKTGAQRAMDGYGLLTATGASPLDTTRIAQAQADFTAAARDFDQVNADLARIPSVADATPHYGGTLASARRLAPLAATLARAGAIACDALGIVASRMKDPLSAKTGGLTADDMNHLGADLTQVSQQLDTAAKQMGMLQPGDTSLDARLGPMLAKLQAQLPGMQAELKLAQAALPVANTVLGIGAPANYLVEVLDSTEIRPGGGFIGNYGIATLNGGKLSGLNITDVDLLDRPFEFAGKTIPFPKQYQWFPEAASWSLRDSNLDADFPTTARNGEQTYQLEGGAAKVQGVIAITPWLIQDALSLTGPINVPEYNVTITAANLVDQIHYHQLGAQEGPDFIASPDGNSSLRKRFSAVLFGHFFEKLKSVAPTHAPQLVKLLTTALHDKDLQVYFNTPQVQALLAHFSVASTIAAPAGDSLFVVDANILANKANDFMSYVLSDSVTLDASGTATHTTTLTYNWPISQRSNLYNYGSKNLYADYLRIYTPPGAVLSSASGWSARNNGSAFGRSFWAGTFSLQYGQSHTITLKWRVPKAAIKANGAWTYTLLVQRQAGITWKANLRVTLPSCAHGASSLAGLAAAGGNALKASQTLATDTTFSAKYTC